MTHAVLIVDDEPPARAKIARLLAAHADFRVVGQAGDVAEAVAGLHQQQPDVVFLDIQLGAGSGFEVLEALRGTALPLIVFTTAYSQHAVRAFEVHALDYLLKPFDRERFALSLERIREALSEPDRGDIEERLRRLLAAQPERAAAPRQLLIREADRAFFIATSAIDRLSAAGNYVEVQADGKRHLVRDTLTALISTLDPADFIRVHRSHVVRIGFISELRPMFHGDFELLLRDGQTLPLSRRYKALLPASLRARL